MELKTERRGGGHTPLRRLREHAGVTGRGKLRGGAGRGRDRRPGSKRGRLLFERIARSARKKQNVPLFDFALTSSFEPSSMPSVWAPAFVVDSLAQRPGVVRLACCSRRCSARGAFAGSIATFASR